MSGQAQPGREVETPHARWQTVMANLQSLGNVAAVLAALVGALYVVGAVVIGVRLGLRDLPSSAVVAQLPREFLLSTGLNVVLPAPAVAVAVYASVALVVGQGKATVARRSAVLAACVAVASAGYYIWKDPFPAKICSEAGGATAVGDFIGETGERVYIGELRDREGRRRIASVPVARVGQLLIGGGAHGARCPKA
ncbi:MAG: hypothetical protein ACRDM0_06015 [Thermoleophilaceae bacterium]